MTSASVLYTPPSSQRLASAVGRLHGRMGFRKRLRRLRSKRHPTSAQGVASDRLKPLHMLLMRARIPARRRARPWNDVVPAPFEYGELDVEGAAARIPLDSTCVNVRNVEELASMREGKLNRVAAM